MFSDYNSLRDVHSTTIVLTAFDGVEPEIITIIECIIRHTLEIGKQVFRCSRNNLSTMNINDIF